MRARAAAPALRWPLTTCRPGSDLKMIQSFGTAVQFAMGFILQNYFTVKLVYLLAALVLSTLCVIYCDLRVEPLDPHRRRERLLETTAVHSHSP